MSAYSWKVSECFTDVPLIGRATIPVPLTYDRVHASPLTTQLIQWSRDLHCLMSGPTFVEFKVDIALQGIETTPGKIWPTLQFSASETDTKPNLVFNSAASGSPLIVSKPDDSVHAFCMVGNLACANELKLTEAGVRTEKGNAWMALAEQVLVFPPEKRAADLKWNLPTMNAVFQCVYEISPELPLMKKEGLDVLIQAALRVLEAEAKQVPGCKRRRKVSTDNLESPTAVTDRALYSMPFAAGIREMDFFGGPVEWLFPELGALSSL